MKQKGSHSGLMGKQTSLNQNFIISIDFLSQHKEYVYLCIKESLQSFSQPKRTHLSKRFGNT